MQILKSGKTAIKYTCSCGCEFTATKKDRQLESNLFLHQIRYYVACPECGEKIIESITEWKDA